MPKSVAHFMRVTPQLGWTAGLKGSSQAAVAVSKKVCPDSRHVLGFLSLEVVPLTDNHSAPQLRRKDLLARGNIRAAHDRLRDRFSCFIIPYNFLASASCLLR